MTSLAARPGRVTLGRGTHRLGWAVACGLFVLGLALLFRDVWWPGPARSLNDNGDGTIVIALLEHWLRVFSGHATSWTSPGWFWPAPHALSFSDTMFLLALPYSAARALGADWFTAIDIVALLLATLGYWGAVLLARRLDVPPAIGGVFAFAFTFGTVPTFKLFHLQTYTLQLAPLIVLMLLAGWRGSRRAALSWSAATGLLVGLLFFTAAQTPWFLGIEIALAGLVAALFNIRHLLALDRAPIVRFVQMSFAFGVGMVVGLVPFALVYRHAVDVQREWRDLLMFSAYPLDVFNLPSGNLLWSGLLHRLGISGLPNRPDLEVALGWPPIEAACALAGFLLFGRIRAAAGPHPADWLVRALLVAAVLGPFISLRFNWFDLWYYVFKFVPGGGSVRTPFRIELAATALLGLALAMVAARAMQAAANRRSAGLAATVGALLALLVVEQIGAGPTTRDSAEMRRWMATVQRPPPSCRAFYLLPSDKLTWQVYASDAMLLSQLVGIPTVNANASFFPKGWDLGKPQPAEYARQALQWIDAHALRDQICGIEPRVGRWIEGVQPLLDAAHGNAVPPG